MINYKGIIEATFLVPINEDRNVGNGELHSHSKWGWLKRELYGRFGGFTISSNLYHGEWENPKTKEKIRDTSRKYFVDIYRKDLDKMRAFIKEIANVFCQDCIRFAYEGKVEYISK